jgi:membrane-bound metal-dependent hydrolase YbcI (DUF457 family)
LGIILGNLIPDLDNLAVAAATVAGLKTEDLHRTFTHSLFTVAAVILVFYVIAGLTKRKRWGYLGLGLGIGILMHILLDLLIWFNGVEILWPIPSWVNLWENVNPPAWWETLMASLEFLFFALLFYSFYRLANKLDTNAGYLRMLRFWIVLQLFLFVLFSVLFYFLEDGLMIPYGALYLFSLVLASAVTIRMRKTIEAVSSQPTPELA